MPRPELCGWKCSNGDLRVWTKNDYQTVQSLFDNMDCVASHRDLWTARNNRCRISGIYKKYDHAEGLVHQNFQSTPVEAFHREQRQVPSKPFPKCFSFLEKYLRNFETIRKEKCLAESVFSEPDHSEMTSCPGCWTVYCRVRSAHSSPSSFILSAPRPGTALRSAASLAALRQCCRQNFSLRF